MKVYRGTNKDVINHEAITTEVMVVVGGIDEITKAYKSICRHIGKTSLYDMTESLDTIHANNIKDMACILMLDNRSFLTDAEHAILWLSLMN